MGPWRRRTALVTGASGAIGSAIARRLAAGGARVAVSGRDGERLARLAGELGGGAEPLPADLVAPGAAEELAARALVALGGLDLLVHAAGTLEPGRLEAAGLDALDRQLDVNLRAPWALTRALLAELARRQGQIAFVNSSVTPRAGLAAYAASKSALKAFADSLRQEVNSAGVRVVSVYPGRTASALLEALVRTSGEEWDPERLMRPDDVAQALLAALELPRTAEVTEIHLRPMQPPG
jgi:NADP-dependent 3-hydroxy acid dehydrogenase YdfG